MQTYQSSYDFGGWAFRLDQNDSTYPVILKICRGSQRNYVDDFILVNLVSPIIDASADIDQVNIASDDRLRTTIITPPLESKKNMQPFFGIAI